MFDVGAVFQYSLDNSSWSACYDHLQVREFCNFHATVACLFVVVRGVSVFSEALPLVTQVGR